MTTLDAIGRKHGTDKSSLHHNYLAFYEPFLAPWRHEPFALIELGIKHGASLKTWESYLPHADILGVDIAEASVAAPFERARTLLGDCGSRPFLAELAARERPRVVLDDASHLWSHQVAAFEEMFPHLEPGGLFIMEDLSTSYGDMRKRYGDRPTDAVVYFTQINTLVTGLGRAHPFHEVMAPTQRQRTLAKSIAWMAFAPKTLVIAKTKAAASGTASAIAAA